MYFLSSDFNDPKIIAFTKHFHLIVGLHVEVKILHANRPDPINGLFFAFPMSFVVFLRAGRYSQAGSSSEGLSMISTLIRQFLLVE